MIHTLKAHKVKPMEKEIRKMLKTLDDKLTSGKALEKRPDYFEGFKDALREVLGE
jgi:hypothetical protein